MKILCCGDRNWTDLDLIYQTLKILSPKIVVHGAARGADSLSGIAAKSLGIEVREYPANWSLHHRAAGPIRNRLQYDTELPDLTIAFHNNLDVSTGTKDMVKYTKSKGGLVLVIKESDFAYSRTEP